MALIAFAGAILFALIQAALPNGIGPLDTAIMFANGLAVAIYAPLLRAAGPIPRRTGSCVALILLGLTHFAWLLPVAKLIYSGLNFVGVSGNNYTNASLFLATGLVFSAVILLDLRTLQSAAILFTATLVSAALMLADDHWRISSPRRPPHMIGLPAAPLHIGIALTLFLAARRERLKPRPGFCPTCNYDLRGLASPLCPECGSPRQ